MKIILTTAEAIEKLRSMFAPSLGENIEIEIARADSLITCIRKAVEPLRYTGDQKIAAIKALRQAIADNKGFMGLADAKNAIENWDSFLAFVDKNGRLPLDGFAYKGMQ